MGIAHDRRTRPLRAGAGARSGAGPVGVPICGARARRSGADGRRAAPTAIAQFVFVALAFAALVACYVRLGFLGRQRVRELAFGEAADLQDHRRLGKPRRLDAAVGADPRRCSARWSRRSATICRRRCKANVLARAGLDRARPSCSSSSLTSNPFLRLAGRRSRAATSTRCCRTSASRSIRRCSISAMSASRSRSPSRSPR